MTFKPQITKTYWFIVVAFLILFAPLALDFNFYYPDEVHYSDAAIEMLQNGDFLTPHQGSGELRFNKPIVSYWFVLLGFKLFGINAFAARFFFFISGALILILVYHISLVLHENKKTALLATMIAVSNVTFLMSSMRSIPDILLCLFITISFYGFAGFLRFGNNTPKKFYWMLFLGMAIAYEVKGIPALILGAIELLFLLLNPWQRIKWKKLIHLPSMLSAIILGSFWFVFMYVYYGNEFIQSFYDDQIGERVAINYFTMLGNIGISFGLMLALLFPWITFVKRQSSFFGSGNKTEKAFRIFAITTIVLFTFASGTAFKVYDRYLLPLVPILAVWMASIIIKTIDKEPLILRIWSILAVLVHGILLAFALTISITLKESAAHYIWLFSGLAISSYILYRLFQSRNVLWLALAVPLIAYNLTIVTHTISFPSEGQQIAKILEKNNIDNHQEIGFIGNPQIASKLRIVSKGQYQITNLNELFAEYESENFKVIVVGQKDMYLFPKTSFTVLGNSINWSSYESNELIYSLFKGDYRRMLAQNGKKYYVLMRNH